MYSEDEYLMISGLQHYSFCPRQWALIHLEQQWEENLRTIDGEILHEKAHDNNFNEKRKGVIITRAMPVSSALLGLSGECDIVEFHPDKNGVTLFGKEQKYICVPIEYKRGSPKTNDCDILQLTAQAMCLEEMLCCEIHLARVEGKINGNVLLRREQYRIADNPEKSLAIARVMIAGKIFNAKQSVERTIRDYGMRIDAEKFRSKSGFLTKSVENALNAKNADELRGIEGEAATVYFSVFDDMILQQKEEFFFNVRNKRPPRDNVNAMLSFAYSLATGMCSSGLESVGLDPYVGFFHTDRPGRNSLALDLVEEFRVPVCDRFVLSLINKKIITGKDFVHREDGAVILTDDGRRAFLKAWQNRKDIVITHPYLNEKMQWGLLPYVQALLLARYVRGDLDMYPVFMWK